MVNFLNFGSINIDYVYQVDRFLQPGETKHSLGREVYSGGKGFNQSIALARAGAKVCHAGRIAKTDSFLIDQLVEAGVDAHLVAMGDFHTGQAIIQVDAKGQNCILLSSGANYGMTPEFISQVLSPFARGDLLLLQNEINGLEQILTQAGTQGLKIALNPSPFEPVLLDYPLDQVAYFLINEVEGQQMTGYHDPKDIAAALLDRYPTSAVVLTLGKEGVWYQDRTNSYSHGVYNVPVVDTVAAGDTFTGFFMAGVSRGQTVPDALKWASVASSICVSRHGAAVSIPTLEEVQREIDFGFAAGS